VRIGPTRGLRSAATRAPRETLTFGSQGDVAPALRRQRLGQGREDQRKFRSDNPAAAYAGIP